MGDGRVIVFAPTFRGAGQATAYYPYDSYIDYQALWEMCERTNSYFVFEMHHFIEERPEHTARFCEPLEGSLGRELGRLALCGRCPGDGLLLLLLRLPSAAETVVFYVPDKVEYSATRGVQRSVDDMAPGVVCDTSEEFVDVLERAAYRSMAPGRIDDRSLLGAGGLCGRPRH